MNYLIIYIFTFLKFTGNFKKKSIFINVFFSIKKIVYKKNKNKIIIMKNNNYNVF